MIDDPEHPELIAAAEDLRQADGGLQLLSKQEAINLGLNRYFTGFPCSRGHIADKYVKNGGCTVCLRLQIKRRTSRGGSQYEKQIARKNRLRKPGGSQRENHVRRLRANTKRRRTKGGPDYLSQSLRARLRLALRSNAKAGSAVRDLGCTIFEFRSYIETKFQSGMTWDNRGEWHLDHIKPLASFDLSNRDQFLMACHFSNYQPLWAADNVAKGAAL